MKEVNHKPVYVDSLAYRQAVSLKLKTTIGKMKKVQKGTKPFGNENIDREVAALAYKMGIKPDASKACPLHHFTPKIAAAPHDQVLELDRVLDKINKGVKAVKEFSKGKP